MRALKEWLSNHKHAWVLGYWPIYLLWFHYLETHVTNHYHIIHSGLDDLIPFNEVFIIPYMLWFVYIAWSMTFFLLKSREEFYRLCIYLFTGMTLSLLICTLFPNGTAFRPVAAPDKNIFSWLVSLIQAADTPTNVFPSIHVFNSVAVYVCVRKSEVLRNCRWASPLCFVLTVLICLSTVFLKQHSVIDIAGALLLAAALYPMVFSGEELPVQVTDIT